MRKPRLACGSPSSGKSPSCRARSSRRTRNRCGTAGRLDHRGRPGRPRRGPDEVLVAEDAAVSHERAASYMYRSQPQMLVLVPRTITSVGRSNAGADVLDAHLARTVVDQSSHAVLDSCVVSSFPPGDARSAKSHAFPLMHQAGAVGSVFAPLPQRLTPEAEADPNDGRSKLGRAHGRAPRPLQRRSRGRLDRDRHPATSGGGTHEDPGRCRKRSSQSAGASAAACSTSTTPTAPCSSNNQWTDTSLSPHSRVNRANLREVPLPQPRWDLRLPTHRLKETGNALKNPLARAPRVSGGGGQGQAGGVGVAEEVVDEHRLASGVFQ